MKKIVFFLLTIFVFIKLNAQIKSPPLVTDRPDQTESSCTVPHKTIQVETGFVYEADEKKNRKEKNISYNSTLLRYGLLRNMELRFGVEYVKNTIEDKATRDEISIDGFEPLFCGIKIAISQQKGIIPEMALLSHLTLPETGKKDFQSTVLLPDMIFSLSYELTPRFSTGVNIGAEWDDKNKGATGIYSWVLGIAIGEKAGTFIETYGTFKKDIPFDSRIDGGFTFLILPNLQIDISGGYGLANISPDYFFGSGLSWRIPQ